MYFPLPSVAGRHINDHRTKPPSHPGCPFVFPSVSSATGRSMRTTTTAVARAHTHTGILWPGNQVQSSIRGIPVRACACVGCMRVCVVLHNKISVRVVVGKSGCMYARVWCTKYYYAPKLGPLIFLGVPPPGHGFMDESERAEGRLGNSQSTVSLPSINKQHSLPGSLSLSLYS